MKVLALIYLTILVLATVSLTSAYIPVRVLGHLGIYGAMYSGLFGAKKLGQLGEHAMHGDWAVRVRDPHHHHHGHHGLHGFPHLGIRLGRRRR